MFCVGSWNVNWSTISWMHSSICKYNAYIIQTVSMIAVFKIMSLPQRYMCRDRSDCISRYNVVKETCSQAYPNTRTAVLAKVHNCAVLAFAYGWFCCTCYKNGIPFIGFSQLFVLILRENTLVSILTWL